MAEGYKFEDYTIVMQFEEDNSILVSILECPGCMSCGDCPDDAVDNLRDAFDIWTEDVLEHGEFVPEPLGNDRLMAWEKTVQEGSTT